MQVRSLGSGESNYFYSGRSCNYSCAHNILAITRGRDTKEYVPNAQMAYLNLLREWFKNNNFTPQVVAAAYMTGILPIKKDGSQPAISDFKEYTILAPGKFVEFTGYTEADVQLLCGKYEMIFDDIKRWYDGYDFPGHGAIYNPYSVMCAMQAQKCRSYWRKTSAAESLAQCFTALLKRLSLTILGYMTIWNSCSANWLSTLKKPVANS